MGLLELILIAIGLSMDAFAVSICKGLNMTKKSYKNCFLIGIFFGGFQALMPFIGWLLGTSFQKYIMSFDHWVAFFLLAIIGGKMIYESTNKDKQKDKCADNLVIKELFILAIATSIDALAVGITLALIPNTNILLSVILIGIITFAFSFVGVLIGNKFGAKYEKKAELVGGIILVLIGFKILLEHLI
ncbi:MAG: manganese efflux pump MntP family protein [Clostridia bacterium]